MGIASIHYLSMNVHDAGVTPPGSPSDAGSQNYAFYSLQADTDYTVDWGDGSSDTQFTSDSNGDSGNIAHTYADDGLYTITVTRDDTGQIAARKDVLVVESTPITNTVAPAITGTITKDEELSVTNGTWTGDATLAYSRQWYRNTANSAVGGTAITNATGTTYTLVSADVGKYIYCVVSANNAPDNDGPVTAASNVVGAIRALPVNTVAPVVSSDGDLEAPLQGDELSTTDGTWTGTPTPTITYQWRRADDDQGTNEADIGSATDNTYTLAAGDAGKYVRCKVTGTNTAGAASAYTDYVGAVT